MRFPLPLPSISAARGFLLFALVTLSLGGACEDKHIGRICELGTNAIDGGSSGSSVAVISSPALECPSRICIYPGGDNAQMANTGPLCTASCSSNDDCSDGETGPKGNPTDRHCENGFVCMWPTGNTGDFACQSFCVCRDFVIEPTGGFKKPPGC